MWTNRVATNSICKKATKIMASQCFNMMMTRGGTTIVVATTATSNQYLLPTQSVPNYRYFSSQSAAAVSIDQDDNDNSNNNNMMGPMGSLFSTTTRPEIGQGLVGATGSIQRVFEPRSNAEGLLVTGGAALAAHASFDPVYDRARGWIRHHAVGPAVLSPILICGLIGALVEAAFPNAIITGQSLVHKRPLIVGVTVTSTIEVMSVTEATKHLAHDDNNNDSNNKPKRSYGYDVHLITKVTRVRDNRLIAEGTHELFVPDYQRM